MSRCSPRIFSQEQPNQRGQSQTAYGWKCETHEESHCCFGRRVDATKASRQHRRNRLSFRKKH